MTVGLHMERQDAARSAAWVEVASRAGVRFVRAEVGAPLSVVHGANGGSVRIPDKGLFEHRDAWKAESSEVLKLVAGSGGGLLPFQLFFEAQGDCLVSRFDLVAVAVGLLLRWEELLDPARDDHGRWPLEKSLLSDERLIGRPVVDLICRSIGDAVRHAYKHGVPAPSPWGGAKWVTSFSFDIDSAAMFRGRAAMGSVRRLMAERGLPAAFRGMGEAMAVNLGLLPDPHDNMDEVALRLAKEGIRSTWFAQAVKAHRLDNYDLRRDNRMVRAIRRLKNLDHEIELHGSYATADRPADFLKRQRRLLEVLAGGRTTMHRAHYLRTTSPADLDKYQEAGLRVDASAGFSTREGFRLGTAFPVMAGPVMQIPLHVMDVTLRYQRALSPAGAFDAATKVMEEVRAVGGACVLLWHPHNMEPRLWRGWEELPFQLVQHARKNGAGILPLGEIATQWKAHFRQSNHPI